MPHVPKTADNSPYLARRDKFISKLTSLCESKRSGPLSIKEIADYCGVYPSVIHGIERVARHKLIDRLKAKGIVGVKL